MYASSMRVFRGILTALPYNFTIQICPSGTKLPKIFGTYRQIRPKNYWKLWHSESSIFDWRNYMATQLLFLVALALTLGIYGGAASAAPSVTVNGGQIEVRARVLPAHTVVVDEQNVIIQVYSNTTETVANPKVYRGSIDAAHEQPLTREVQDEYRSLMQKSESRVGTLYDRNSIPYLLNMPLLNLFPVQSSPLLTLR